MPPSQRDQAAEEFIRKGMDLVCPDDWLDDGLEPLRGKKFTLSQAMVFRSYYCAVKGIRNKGLKDMLEIHKRVIGPIPTIVRHGEAPPEDDLEKLTDVQLWELLDQLSTNAKKSIRAPKPKQLKEANAPQEPQAESAASQG